MKFRKLLAAALAMAMALSMCAFASAEGADAVKIGVIGPLTGPAAVYGTAVARAAQIAVDEINAQGGLQLALDVQDDENDPEKGVNAFNAILDNGGQMILGTVTTAPCIAVAAEAYDARVFMLTPSASSTKVIEDKDNMYQVCFTDPAQGAASAQYISDKALGTKIGVIYNNGSDYSVGIYQTFMAKAAELGLEVVAESTFSSEDNADFSVQLSACKNSGADLVFLPIYYTPASLILKQAQTTDYAPIFFGVDGMDGILTLEGFDTSLAEGVLLLTPFSADAEDEKTQAFVAKYQELYNEVPNQFAADAYDGIYALYAAVQNAGITAETSPEDACELLIEQFQQITVEGLTGTMTWAATGEVTKTPTAVVIENGVYVGVK